MPKVIWNKRAIKDVQQISEFIAENSIYHAEKMVDAIVLRSLLLEHQQLIGKPVPEPSKEYHRQLFIGKYRMIYSVRKLPIVEILRIYHSARLLKL